MSDELMGHLRALQQIIRRLEVSYFVPDDFLHHICENPSSETSQVAIALIMLIQSLKEQPHFDKAMFRDSIQSALSHVESNQPILKEILSALA